MIAHYVRNGVHYYVQHLGGGESTIEQLEEVYTLPEGGIPEITTQARHHTKESP